MIKDISSLKDVPFSNTYYLNISVRETDVELVIKKKKTLERGNYIQTCCLH